MKEQHQAYAERIKRTIEELRKNGGGIKEETFWEFRKKVTKRPEEQAKAMVDEKGNKKEGKEEIIEIYRKFYEDLFEKSKPNTEEERKKENEVNKKLEMIKEKAKQQDPLSYNKDDISKVIKH